MHEALTAKTSAWYIDAYIPRSSGGGLAKYMPAPVLEFVFEPSVYTTVSSGWNLSNEC